MKLNSLFNIKGKVIIITGGSGFLGKAYMNFLTGIGAIVINFDINNKPSVDITKEDIVNKETAKIFNKYKKIDVLINNASLNFHINKTIKINKQDYFSPIENYPVEAFRKGLEVDLVGSFIVSKKVFPYMKKSGKGVIINISSIYGLIAPDQKLYKDIKNPFSPEKDVIKPVYYSVCKAGMWGLTTYLASYGAPEIRVNQLTLGGIHNKESSNFVKCYSKKTMLKRMGCVEDVYGALLFLATDASSYMTGANLVLDGGFSAW